MVAHTSHKHGTFSWLDLPSHDLAATKAFYSGLFGWTYADMPVGEGMIYSMCLKEGAAVCALSSPMPGGPAQPQWNSYITVADVDATVEKAKAAGGEIFAHHDVFDAGRMALVKDPSGAHVALWQARQHIGAHRLNEHGALAWNELHSTDVAAAKKFYTDAIGWGSSEMPMGPGMVYTLFCESGNPQRTHGGLMPAQPGVASHWQVVFQVDDCDAAVAKVKASGGKVLAEAQDMPGIGRFAKCADPQGAAFSVIQAA